MPPVFGPSSWSNTRLWSCAEASGIAVSPSHSAKKLISRPAQKLLDHDFGAGRAERAVEHHGDGGLGLAHSVLATTTPLPAASPSALTTIGAPCART